MRAIKIQAKASDQLSVYRVSKWQELNHFWHVKQNCFYQLANGTLPTYTFLYQTLIEHVTNTMTTWTFNEKSLHLTVNWLLRICLGFSQFSIKKTFLKRIYNFIRVAVISWDINNVISQFLSLVEITASRLENKSCQGFFKINFPPMRPLGFIICYMVYNLAYT